jgi:hypothetical protein
MTTSTPRTAVAGMSLRIALPLLTPELVTAPTDHAVSTAPRSLSNADVLVPHAEQAARRRRLGGDRPEADVAAARLLKNPEDVGNAVVPFYGADAAVLTDLLNVAGCGGERDRAGLTGIAASPVE